MGSIYKKQEKKQVLESLKVLETIQTVSAKRSSACDLNFNLAPSSTQHDEVCLVLRGYGV